MDMSQEELNKWFAKGATWISPQGQTVYFKQEKITPELVQELEMSRARITRRNDERDIEASWHDLQ